MKKKKKCWCEIICGLGKTDVRLSFEPSSVQSQQFLTLAPLTIMPAHHTIQLTKTKTVTILTFKK